MGLKIQKLFVNLLTFFTLYSHALASNNSTFRFRIGDDFGSIDWGKGEVNGVVIQQITEGLTLTDKNGKTVPGVAKRWTVRSLGGGGTSEIDFALDRKARWNNGTSVCASDFVRAWKRVASKEFASPYAHYLNSLTSVDDLKAPSCQKLRVRVKIPAKEFLALTSHWVLAPYAGKLDVTNGPYQVKNWTPGKSFVLEKNHHYRKPNSGPSTVVAQVVASDETATRLFETGELDWVKDLPVLDARRLKKNIEYIESPALIGYHLGFRMDQGQALTRDQRCALAASINKAEIPAILTGTETPAVGFVPQALLKKTQTMQAKLNGHTELPPQLELYYYSKAIHENLMTWLQGRLLKAFPKTKFILRKMDSKAYWARLQADAPGIFLSGTTATYAHPNTFLRELLSDAGGNWGHFKSSTYDQWVKSGEIKNLIRAEELVVSQECAIVPLYFRNTLSLVNVEKWPTFWINPMAYTYFINLSERRKP